MFVIVPNKPGSPWARKGPLLIEEPMVWWEPHYDAARRLGSKQARATLSRSGPQPETTDTQVATLYDARVVPASVETTIHRLQEAIAQARADIAAITGRYREWRQVERADCIRVMPARTRTEALAADGSSLRPSPDQLKAERNMYRHAANRIGAL